jgi:DNA-binding NtrC family response regulator
MLSPTGKNLLGGPDRPEIISILVVSSHLEDQTALSRILPNGAYRFSTVTSVSQAEAFLNREQPSVIVSERDLPDGGWRDVLACAESKGANPAVVVISRQADDALWSSVLNGGGYDVLQKPFEKSEVTRVLGMAWRNTRARILARSAQREPSFTAHAS